jgi:hypothetical protein
MQLQTQCQTGSNTHYHDKLNRNSSHWKRWLEFIPLLMGFGIPISGFFFFFCGRLERLILCLKSLWRDGSFCGTRGGGSHVGRSEMVVKYVIRW